MTTTFRGPDEWSCDYWRLMPKPYITKGTRVQVRYLKALSSVPKAEPRGMDDVAPAPPSRGFDDLLRSGSHYMVIAHTVWEEFTGVVRNIWSNTPDGSGKVTFNVERDDTGKCEEVDENHLVAVYLGENDT